MSWGDNVLLMLGAKREGRKGYHTSVVVVFLLFIERSLEKGPVCGYSLGTYHVKGEGLAA